MYSLDINFLKDRPDYQPTGGPKPDTPKKVPAGNMTPLILGVLIGLLLPGAVGGLWFFLQQQNAKLENEIASIDSELATQAAEKKKISEINEQIKRVEEETKALATVFNQIKPWSALLEDIRQRVPAGVQIQTITQTEAELDTASQPSPSPQASPSPGADAAPSSTPSINLTISGVARSFDDVNYFLLTLQRSAFLKSDTTQIVSAQLVKNPNKLEVNLRDDQNESAGKVTYELPQLVDYTITTTLSDVPAEELLRELDRKGAIGLVTRIRTIQNIEQQQETKETTQTTTQKTTE